mmetsp:Transcript_18227/g.45431  ORF Transcript_18227/g.45431 Transcript_18227/m.45431 type:complete len:438 (-) Transcript_18227:82-1395(-)
MACKMARDMEAAHPRELHRLVPETPQDQVVSRRTWTVTAFAAVVVVVGAMVLTVGAPHATAFSKRSATDGKLSGKSETVANQTAENETTSNETAENETTSNQTAENDTTSNQTAEEDEAALVERYPLGFMVLEECGVDYTIETLMHSNFGGQGPDTGEEGIKYNVTEHMHGVYQRNLMVKVNALTDYQCSSASKNGMRDDFGSITVDSGHSVDALFSIWDFEGSPITLDTFRMTFFDIDSAPQERSKEFIIADNGDPEALTSGITSQVIEETVHDDQGFVAGAPGTAADNPKMYQELTQAQKDKSVVLSYKDVHSFRLTMGATDGNNPRGFYFAFHSALACEKIKVAITTTVQTTTGTTAEPGVATGLFYSMLAGAAALLACCGGIMGFLCWRHTKGAQKKTTTKTVTTVTTTFSDSWFGEEGREDRGATTTTTSHS